MLQNDCFLFHDCFSFRDCFSFDDCFFFHFWKWISQEMESYFSLLNLSFVENCHISISTTFAKQSTINRLSNAINRIRSAAKISKVMSSSPNPHLGDWRRSAAEPVDARYFNLSALRCGRAGAGVRDRRLSLVGVTVLRCPSNHHHNCSNILKYLSSSKPIKTRGPRAVSPFSLASGPS